jgi:hypothetical protein
MIKLVDNIDYKLVIENYKKEVEILKNCIKKEKYYIVFKIICIIFGIFLLFLSFSNINFNTKELMPKDVGYLFILVIGLLMIIALSIFLIFNFDDLKYDNKKYLKAITRLNTEESLEDKAFNISKEQLFYSSYNISDLKERVNFIEKNYKIIKMQYDLKENNLYVRYVENNEIKEKKFYCEIHYFEELENPELVLTNKKILLNIKYKEEISFETIDIIS